MPYGSSGGRPHLLDYVARGHVPLVDEAVLADRQHRLVVGSEHHAGERGSSALEGFQLFLAGHVPELDQVFLGLGRPCPAEASILPSGLKATPKTASRWAPRFLTSLPSAGFQSRTVLSCAARGQQLAVGAEGDAVDDARVAFHFAHRLPSPGFQSRMVSSRLDEASKEPSLLKATQ